MSALVLVGLLAPLTLSAAVPGSAAAEVADAGPYLVRAHEGALAAADALVRAAGGTVRDTLAPLDTLVVDLPEGAAAALRRGPGVAAVSPDTQVGLAEEGSAAVEDAAALTGPEAMHTLQTVVGARALWPAGAGQGIDVALLDSGVADVPGLDAPGKVVHGPDLSNESQDADRRNRDTFGHGTHMAGIIAGRDAGAVADEAYDPATTYLGVAPGARLVSVRVAGASGATDVSQVIAGISWVVQHAQDPGFNIRVLSLSFGTDATQDYRTDPLAHAAEVAWRAGIVVVTSAGNGGRDAGRLTNPAVDPYVLAVGADDTAGTVTMDDDVVPAFSSSGDGRRDPDVVAPGVHVQSLRAPGSSVDRSGSAGQVGGRYQRGSGTSQSTAVVAGAAALLLGQRPALTPDQVKGMLMLSARRVPGTGYDRQGAGLIDVRRAAGMRVPASWQSWSRATGIGSLEQARGSAHVSDRGAVLTGEKDIFGKTYDAAALSRQIEDRSSWQGGRWNGSTWAGSTWAGSTWAGSTWAGTAWAGTGWAAGAWR